MYKNGTAPNPAMQVKSQYPPLSFKAINKILAKQRVPIVNTNILFWHASNIAISPDCCHKIT